MITVSSLLLVTLLAGPAAAPPSPAPRFPSPRVRAMDASAARLIAGGRARSLTVRAMIDRLERGHLIVMVRTTTVLGHPGERVFLGANGPYRYVSISIRMPAIDYDPVTWLAHELQHAIEILDAPEIVDQSTLVTYGQRTGMASHTDGELESDEAQRVWIRVRYELQGASPPSHDQD